MANDPKTDALSTLRARLAAHVRDPRASMLGLGPTLQALDAAVVELDRRTGAIAAAHLELLSALVDGRKYTTHAARIDDLGAMNDYAGVLARRIRAQVTTQETR